MSRVWLGKNMSAEKEALPKENTALPKEKTALPKENGRALERPFRLLG